MGSSKLCVETSAVNPLMLLYSSFPLPLLPLIPCHPQAAGVLSVHQDCFPRPLITHFLWLVQSQSPCLAGPGLICQTEGPAQSCSSQAAGMVHAWGLPPLSAGC